MTPRPVEHCLTACEVVIKIAQTVFSLSEMRRLRLSVLCIAENQASFSG